MKKILLILLLAFASLAYGQTPTLTFRESNTNELDMTVYKSGLPVQPGSSLTLTAEVRASDQGRVELVIPMTAVDTSAGLIRGLMPYLKPNIYYLGLYFKYSSGVQFRVGVSRLNILPAGSLKSIADASGLNVQISEQKVVPNVYLDATPASSVAAYWAGQAKQAYDSLSAYSHARDDGQDTQISARVTLATYNNNRTNDLNALALKANSSDVYSKTQSDALYKPISFTPTWSALPDKPTLFSGSYTDLANKPTIPTSASQVGAYSTAQVDNLLVTKVEYTSRATYASMLTITPLPNTIIIVYVDYDEKHSMPNQEYKILPSGKRTWAAQIEDN